MQPLDTPASKENVDPQHPRLMAAAAALQNTDGRRSKKHKTDAQSTRNYAQALRKWAYQEFATKELAHEVIHHAHRSKVVQDTPQEKIRAEELPQAS